MKQTLVHALFAFLVATATTTWFVTKIAPPRDGVSEARGDTSKVKPALGAAPKSTPAGAAANPPAGKPDSGRPGTPKVATVAGPVTRSAAGAYVPDPAEAARAKAVAKIMASMKPKDAVDILSKLSDDEVERIIRQLNAKQVAALMPVLPQERAAMLSRRLLEPRTGPQGGA